MFVWMLAAALSSGLAEAPIGATVKEFALYDSTGGVHRLSDFRRSRVVAVVFLGTQCPLARLYAPRIGALSEKYRQAGVTFLAADPQPDVEAHALASFVSEYRPGLPLWRDPDGATADRLGATHVPTVVVLDESRSIRYRGRIDDQYTFAAHLKEPRQRDLENALDAVLAGKPAPRAEVPADGCPIERGDPSSDHGRTTWSGGVAGIVARRCATCHRDGCSAPFSLTTYREVRRHARGIGEAVNDGRMPPWSAVGPHGVFANDVRLTDAEKRTLIAWLAADCPEGQPTESFAASDNDGWTIPKPDMVVSMPVEFDVPAEGVVDYQTFDVPLGNREAVWVKAVEIRAGNPAVVHHCNVYLKPAGEKMPRFVGSLGSFCLATTTQLRQSTVYPAGMAKRIPAGWQLSFMMHYTPIGKPQKDRTSIGLSFADPRAVRQEVATHCLIDETLTIPPHAKDFLVVKSWTAPADVVLLSLFPHMHLRGRAFLYEAMHPDGRTETLLDVPRFDYAWQHRYEFASPRRFPMGTTIRCTGVYDNSNDNPANPDPNVAVRAGQQVWDEMFNGYFDWAIADQDLVAERGWTATAVRVLRHPAVAACILAATAFFALRFVARIVRRREVPVVRAG